MTAQALIATVTKAGGKLRVTNGQLWALRVPPELDTQLSVLKSEIIQHLRAEGFRTCPECRKSFDSPNACADHMRFECPRWCPDCNTFIMRNSVCPGCELKTLPHEEVARRCDESFQRLKRAFSLKRTSGSRLPEIVGKEPWQILPKKPRPKWRGARYRWQEACRN